MHSLSSILEKAKILISRMNLFDADNEASIYAQISEFIIDNLDATIVLVFPLSFTAFPAFKPLLYGHAADLELNLGDASSDLGLLIEKWKPADFILDANGTNATTKVSLTAYLCSQGITSFQFRPVGTSDDPISVLIVGYKKNRPADSSDHSLIMDLLELLMSSRVSALRYKSFYFESMGRSELNTHRLFGKYGLKCGARQVYSMFLRQVTSENLEIETSGLTDLINGVDHLLDELRIWESSSSYHSIFEKSITLEQNLQFYIYNLYSSIEHRFNVTLDIDTAIEYEKLPIMLTLFRVITESINNALYHGKATSIQVIVRRERDLIYIRVTNNGISLPIEVRPDPNGIFFLLNKIHRLFGAKFTVANQESGVGTFVECSIPSIQIAVQHE